VAHRSSEERNHALWLVAPAGLVLAWAAPSLPWATVGASGYDGTVAVRGGGPGAALAVIGVVATVAAIVGWATVRTRATATLLLVLGIMAVVGSGVLMLHTIYLANEFRRPSHALTPSVGWTTTKHGIGVVVGGAASLVVLVVGAAVRAGARG
jgi:hypothetical protein